jgi:glutathione S-transferase
MQLVIGNKMYSSWSLRPWILMRAFDIPFTETLIPLDTPEFGPRLAAFTDGSTVPVLVDGEVTVWESLAIIEYLADRYPGKAIWPADPAARALARAMSSEMHAGFTALRDACPMNLGKRYARRDRGMAVAGDVARICTLWRRARDSYGSRTSEPFLFGAFNAVDAMYAPVVARLDTYDIAVAGDVRTYMDAILVSPAFAAWRDAALDERWVVDADEVEETPVAILRRSASENRPS